MYRRETDNHDYENRKYERQQRERQRYEYEDRYPNYRELIEQRERHEQRYGEQNRENRYRYEKRNNEREIGEYSRERTRRYDDRENEEHHRNQEPEGKRLKDLNGDYSICYYHAKNETTYTKTVCKKGEESCKYKHPIICKNTNCGGENICKKVHLVIENIEYYKVQGFIPYKQDWQKEIECRYIKNGGTCKNGRGCNYKHENAVLVEGKYIGLGNRINEENQQA